MASLVSTTERIFLLIIWYDKIINKINITHCVKKNYNFWELVLHMYKFCYSNNS